MGEMHAHQTLQALFSALLGSPTTRPAASLSAVCCVLPLPDKIARACHLSSSNLWTSPQLARSQPGPASRTLQCWSSHSSS